ncbi:MAG TPA: hypothetical protein VG712_05335 [Gemmatimonadales bacterium]|nr:hypothetical protein [Gemmatimonadales bacterium]
METIPTLAVWIEFGAGYLTLGPDDDGMLYDAELRYDQERATPEHRYDAAAHRLDLRLRPIGNAGVRVTNREQLAQRASVSLTPAVPLTLDVTLGAGDGELELGGMKIRSAAVHSVATRTLIRASRPNTIACEALDLDGGAAEVITEHLGNLRCAEIRFEGGVGATTLDLTGRWNSTLRVRAKQALGTLKLVLPKDAGVRIVLDGSLTSFDPSGFTRDAGAWVTPNYRSAARTIQVDVTTAVGGIEVVWQ